MINSGKWGIVKLQLAKVGPNARRNGFCASTLAITGDRIRYDTEWSLEEVMRDHWNVAQSEWFALRIPAFGVNQLAKSHFAELGEAVAVY
jgi:hypothetical protein